MFFEVFVPCIFILKWRWTTKKTFCPEAYKTSPMATKSGFSVFKIYKFFFVNKTKNMFFLEPRFGQHFRPILEAFWDPKSWIFTFFACFLLFNFVAFFGRRKKLEKIVFCRSFAGPRPGSTEWAGPLGRDLEMGMRTSELRLMRVGKINDKFHDWPRHLARPALPSGGGGFYWKPSSGVGGVTATSQN